MMKRKIDELLGSWSNAGIFVLMLGSICVGGIVQWVHVEDGLADLKQTVIQQGQSVNHQLDQEQQTLDQHTSTLANHEGRIEVLEHTIPVLAQSYRR
jgi:hypothetical protein